jgi:hypothetical protein
MKLYRRMQVQLHAFSPSALYGGEWSALRTGRFIPVEGALVTLWREVCVGPTAGLGAVKVKLSQCLTKHHAMKTYWGSGDIAPRILDVGTRWRWIVSFTPRPLYPQRKNPCWTRWRREKFLAPAGNPTPAVQPGA